MASIGYILRKEREKKKISLEQVSEETKIATKYLKALENDDYTIFPGETYIIGFMRNYSRAIGLDPVDIVRQYKSTKMKSVEESELKEEPIIPNEQPVPKPVKEKKKPKIKEIKTDEIDVIELDNEFEPEQPQRKKKKKEKKEKKNSNNNTESFSPMPVKEKRSINILHLIIGVGGVLILVGLFFLIKFIVVSLSSVENKEIVSNLEEIKLLEFSNEFLKYDFSVNEYYKIKLGTKTHTIMFEKLTAPIEVNTTGNNTTPSPEFAFHLDDIIIQTKVNEQKSFDFDLDGKKDLSLIINNFNKDIVTATIKKLHPFIIVSNNNKLSNIPKTNNSSTNMRKHKSDAKDNSSYTTKKGKIILDAIVKEKTYIKAFLDGKEQEGVIYYPKQKIHLEANDVMQLKIGNAGGIVAVINGKKTKLGKRGEIANKIIKWERDPYDESAYNLIIKDWQ